MGLRKDQASLDAAESLRFINALITLKNDVPSQTGLASRYDDFVSFHFHAHHSMTMTKPGAAHRGPAFLPWHREYLRRFELELRTINPQINIPYWDWTKDSLPHSSLWDLTFMGGDGDSGNGDIVSKGRFGSKAGQWPITLPDPMDASPYLRRALGRSRSTTLPTAQEVQFALAVTPYYTYPWRAFSNLATRDYPVRPSFCNRLEGNYSDSGDSMHNQVHAWVGGTMASIMGSPNDPVFWLVHANIDRLWAQWQRLHPESGYHPTGLPGEIGPLGHNLNDPMHPWGGGSTPASVLWHIGLNYWYDSDPKALQDLAQALAGLPEDRPAMNEAAAHSPAESC